MSIKLDDIQERNSAIRPALDRRTLLTAAGGTVAAGLGFTFPDTAAAATNAPGGMRRIDAYSHISSLKYLDALEKQQGKPAAISAELRRKPSLTDLKARLAGC
jgi:hypothetical protein